MLNENNPIMGGGHYKCSKCGETVFGSALHYCSDNEIEIETIKLPKKQEESESWDKIFGQVLGQKMKHEAIIGILKYLKQNYLPPQKK